MSISIDYSLSLRINANAAHHIFADAIRPVCLATSDDVDDAFVDARAVATGWGATSDADGNAVEELRMIRDREVISNDACAEYFGSSIFGGNICIETAEGHGGVCHGDSGGPLNLPVGGNVYKQIGIASFVSGAGCTVGSPHVYARVTEYLDWIGEHTEI